MKKLYRISIEAEIITELSLEEIEDKIDIGLLKYWVNEIIPKWEDQSLSQEWFIISDYQNVNVELADYYDDDEEDDINS